MGFLFEIMNGVADDATVDAGLFVGFKEIFNRERRRTAPTPLTGEFGWVNMGMESFSAGAKGQRGLRDCSSLKVNFEILSLTFVAAHAAWRLTQFKIT